MLVFVGEAVDDVHERDGVQAPAMVVWMSPEALRESAQAIWIGGACAAEQRKHYGGVLTGMLARGEEQCDLHAYTVRASRAACTSTNDARTRCGWHRPQNVLLRMIGDAWRLVVVTLTRAERAERRETGKE